MMDKNYYIRLTMAVYRVTELFPENEPLKLKIREKADDLLADLIEAIKGNPGIENKELTEIIDKDISIINGFFELAQEQDWVDPRNFSVLKGEYDKIRQKWEQVRIICRANNSDLSLINLNERQKRILKVLEKKDRVQVWEIKEIFPDITKRTLRRDFEYLLNQKLIKRIGERNDTFYQLIRHLPRRVGQ